MGSLAFRIVVVGRNYRFVVEEPTEREAASSAETALRQLSGPMRRRLARIKIACSDLEAAERLKAYFINVMLELEMA